MINEMSPYLLLGFLLAGLMHSFIPGKLYSRYLSRPTFSSVINAALLGIPLPLCSCGVIPTAMSLRKEGASKGATTSFLIATPQTGIDSIIATWSLMGLPFAIIRPIAALLTALLGGQMVNLLDNNKDKAPIEDADTHCHDDNCHCGEDGPEHQHNHTHEHNADEHKSFGVKLLDAIDYAFDDMMSDIGKWLVIGLIVAGLITVCVPDSLFEVFAGNSLMSMLLVLCLAVPMYLCATGSIPIAVALMMKGLTPGAGLVLLMAGPASNVASILIIRKVLGNRTQLIYLASIITGAILSGLAIDHLMPREWFISSLVNQDACCHESSLFNWICTFLLCQLLINALVVKPYKAKRNREKNNKIIMPTDMNEKIYHIEGMNCNHCRMSAEKALHGVAGVESAVVDLTSKEARVTGTATRDALKEAIEAVGFELKD